MHVAILRSGAPEGLVFPTAILSQIITGIIFGNYCCKQLLQSEIKIIKCLITANWKLTIRLYRWIFSLSGNFVSFQFLETIQTTARLYPRCIFRNSGVQGPWKLEFYSQLHSIPYLLTSCVKDHYAHTERILAWVPPVLTAFQGCDKLCHSAADLTTQKII